DDVAVDVRDRPIHVDVFGPGCPGICEQVHAHVVDPLLRAGAVDDDGVADGQARGRIDGEADRADGDVLVGDGVGGPRDGGARAGAVELDDGALAGSGRMDERLRLAGTAQDDATGGDAEVRADFVRAGRQQ